MFNFRGQLIFREVAARILVAMSADGNTDVDDEDDCYNISHSDRYTKLCSALENANEAVEASLRCIVSWRHIRAHSAFPSDGRMASPAA